jgi:uncharacterized membrane protein
MWSRKRGEAILPAMDIPERPDSSPFAGREVGEPAAPFPLAYTPPPVPAPAPAPTPRARFWTAPRLAQATRTGLLLATTTMSVVLFVFEVMGWGRWLDALVGHNKAKSRERLFILLAMIGCAGLAALGTWGVLMIRRRPSTLERARTLALFLSPLSVLGLMVPLLRLEPWKNNPMTLGCGVAIVAYLIERTMTISLAHVPDGLRTHLGAMGGWLMDLRPRLWNALPLILVVLGMVGYTVLVGLLCLRHHYRLGTAAFDLGGYDNIFYSALKGHPLRGTVAVPSGEDWSSMKTHAELSLYFFLPIYAIRPSAETLLWMQSAVVALGAFPVYGIAARHLSKPAALLLAFAYLLFPAIHSGNFYDFHFQPLASTSILWCFYFLDTRRNLAFSIAFVVALGCREDASISLAVAGFLMVCGGYRPRMGLLVAIVSTLYFFVIKFVLMPIFGSWWFSDMYKDLVPPGLNGFFGVIATLITNPIYALDTLLTREKVLHVLKIFLPLAFLPLRRTGLWFGFVPAILGTILTTGYSPTTSTTFQYVYYWVPFIFVFAIVVLEHLARWQGRRALLAALTALTFASLASSYHWGVVFQHENFASAWGRINLDPLSKEEWQTLGDLRILGKKIPPTASVSASEGEVPHISTRLTVYTLRLSGANGADYVLYHRDSGDFGAKQGREALSSGDYKLVEERGKFTLLKRAGLP